MTRIVILTGAGISAESGLGTFRDTGGLWTSYDLNEVATPEGFAANPALVHEFYNARRKNSREASPNAAHLALAELEAALPQGDLLIVTQNVDDLHQRAGSKAVLQMHGALERARCAACGMSWHAPEVMSPADPCPHCAQAATRPDIVWFGEQPHHLDAIEDALRGCEIFAAIGSSGNVYPAADFVRYARRQGADCTELNLEPSEGSQLFHNRRIGPATEVVPAWLREIVAP